MPPSARAIRRAPRSMLVACTPSSNSTWCSAYQSSRVDDDVFARGLASGCPWTVAGARRAGVTWCRSASTNASELGGRARPHGLVRPLLLNPTITLEFVRNCAHRVWCALVDREAKRLLGPFVRAGACARYESHHVGIGGANQASAGSVVVSLLKYYGFSVKKA